MLTAVTTNPPPRQANDGAATPRQSRFSRLLAWPSSRTGWVGIDVGTESIRMAQVERDGDHFRFAARWSETSTESNGIHDCWDRIRQARRMFRGRRAAAATSVGPTAHRTMKLPRGDYAELRNMIQEELAADPTTIGEPPCFGFWETLPPLNSNAEMTQVSVLDMPRNVALSLARNVAGAGLECRVIDGLPCALARAAHMANPGHGHLPSAMLDLDQDSALLVVAVQGLPQFTRVLRGCGFAAFLAPLTDALQLSSAEARQLLRRFGLSNQNAAAAGDNATHVVEQLLALPLAKLVTEIRRTLHYVQQSLAAIAPDRIWLCGGSALLPLLSATLTNELGLDVANWSLSGSDALPANADESLFAVAAALSAIAWETV